MWPREARNGLRRALSRMALVAGTVLASQGAPAWPGAVPARTPPGSVPASASPGFASPVTAQAPDPAGAQTNAVASAVVREHLPLAPLVRDPVFALLVGYVRAGQFGVVTRDEVKQALTERKRESRLPWQRARDFARVPDPSGATASQFTLRFEGPVDVPIPYKILWYHPGRIRASATNRMREWRLATLPVEAPTDWRGAPLPPLTEVHLLALDEGELILDFDGWLDAMMGASLDDTRLGGLAVARFRDREYGFGIGHNRKGESRIGVFDLTEDKVLFPIPADLRAAYRAVRKELERLANPPVAR